MKFEIERDEKKEKDFEIPASNIVMKRSWLSLSEGNRIIREIEGDLKFTIGEMQIVLLPDSARPYQWGLIEQKWGRNGKYYYGEDIPATSAYFTTRGPIPHLEERILQSLGCDDINELIWFKLLSDEELRPENCQNYDRLGIFLIIPHWYAQISEIEVGDKEAKISLKSKLSHPPWKNLRLSCRELTHSHMKSSGRIYEVGKDGVVHLKNFREDIKHLEVTLLFKPKDDEEIYLVDYDWNEKKYSKMNPRLLSYEFFDADSEFLQDSLLRPKSGTNDFEWAVSTLLSIIGFQVEWLGYTQGRLGRGEADIIVIDEDDNSIFIIECTIAEGDLSRKIQSVATRAVSLKEKLSKWEIIPIVCTTLNDNQLTASGFKPPQAGNVRIISLDDLKEMLKLLKAGYPRQELVSRLF